MPEDPKHESAREDVETGSAWYAQFGDLVTNVADGVVVVDDGCRIRYMNPAAESLFGVRFGSRTGSTCEGAPWRLLEPDGTEVDPADHACRRVVTLKKAVAGVERVIRRADGTETDVLVSGNPLRDPSGAVAGAVTTYTDITERRRTEEVLRERSERDASLLRLYALLGKAETYREILAALTTELTRMTPYKSIWISVVDEPRENAYIVIVEGEGANRSVQVIEDIGPDYRREVEDATFLKLPVAGDPMMEEIVEGTHIVVLEDARTDPRANQEIEAVSDNRTIINAPLMLGDHMAGALGLGTFGEEGPLPPTPEVLEYLTALSNHAAVAMDRVHSLRERAEAECALAKKGEYSNSLLRLYADLGRAETYRGIVEAVRPEIERMLGYRSTYLQLVRGDMDELLMLDAGGPVEESIKSLIQDERFRTSLHGEDFLILPLRQDPYLMGIFGSGDVYVCEDAQTHPLTNKDIIAVTGNRTMVCIPLVLAEKTLGLFSMGTFFDEGVLVPDEMQIDYLRALSYHVAVAIDRVRFLGERREAEEALRASEERHRRFVETSLEGVWAIDAELRTVYATDRMGQLLGCQPEEMIGRSILGFVFEKDREEFLARMERRRKGERGSYEMRFRKCDGSGIWLHMSAVPMTAATGEFTGSFAMATDISDRKTAEAHLEQALERTHMILDGVVEALSSTTSQRDPYTALHQERVARLAVAIAEDMGLGPRFVASLRVAALLHDIGKIAVPSEILSKPSTLGEMEMGIVRTHASIGYELLEHVPFDTPVAKAVLQHHERLDGSGYPVGLHGDEILLEARILGVADVVEAMASHRPYRAALGMAAALEEVSSKAGKAFDERVVASCLKVAATALTPV